MDLHQFLLQNRLLKSKHNMRVFILGIDGYIGWSLAQYLSTRGHIIGGIDALLRRAWVTEVGGQSALPIATIEDRLAGFEQAYGQRVNFWQEDILNYDALKDAFREFEPEVVVHLGEMPSAPYSMLDQAHAAFTQHNNVIGSLNVLWAIKENCPNAHLVKLGTLGEYGTPNIDIPEGFMDIEYRGRHDKVPFPKQANSFYHWSKVHDSNNIMFACRVWGITATDIMQGVVFGTRFPGQVCAPSLNTRLDFDSCFGTAINRFCCQAIIGHPITVYGAGTQIRGFLPLRDALKCISLALENPPEKGEYRVLNQFESCYQLMFLACLVQETANEIGLDVSIINYHNPRHELEDHYFNPDRSRLIELGYDPTKDIVGEIRLLLADLLQAKDRILEKQHIFIPDIRWDGTQQRSNPLKKH
jgi:UDP-sulfoquinovose synthase